MKRYFLSLSFLFLALGLTHEVRAAQPGFVQADEAEVYEKPGNRGARLKTLKKGERIQMSNQSRNGFYKIRTSDRTIGFISEDSVSPGNPTRENVRRIGDRRGRKSDSGEIKKFEIAGIFGLDLFSGSEIEKVIGFSGAFGSGYHFGLQLEYHATPRLSYILRPEWIKKQAVITDADTDIKFNFDIGSNPISVGVGYRFTDPKSKLFFKGIFLLGAGMNTHFKATAEDVDSPNSQELKATSLHALLLLTGNWQISSNVVLFAEAGYRYLKTSELEPSSDVDNESINYIFRDVETNEFVPFQINLSGPVLGLGLALQF